MVGIGLLGCVEDTEVTRRVWHCLDPDREVWTWPDTGYSDGEVRAECSRQAGSSCGSCSLDEVSGASAPRSCSCSGECTPLHNIVRASWAGISSSPIVGQYECVRKLQQECEAYMVGNTLEKVFWGQECFE
jgi:hypothetical protein